MDKKHRLLTSVAHRLDLPTEALLGDPCVELKGSGELEVLRHRGVVGYDARCVRIATELGLLSVEGEGLCIARMNRERIVIFGRIDAVRWGDAP